MANEFLVKNGLISRSDIIVTGSLLISQTITASAITSSFTGSLLGTASYALNFALFGNVDGGRPDSIYGGATSIDAGGP